MEWLKIKTYAFGMAATLALHAAAGALLSLDGVPSVAVAAPLVVSLVDSAGETRLPAPPKPEVKPITRPQPPETPPASLNPPEALAPAPPEPVADAPAPASAIVLPRFDADYLDNPPPIYPMQSRRLGEQGRVVLYVLVRVDGTPAEVMIHRSSGSARLDHAALEAAWLWRFVPARRGDSPVAAPVLVPISFTLEG